MWRTNASTSVRGSSSAGPGPPACHLPCARGKPRFGEPNRHHARNLVAGGSATNPMFWAACTGNGYPLFKSTDLVHWTAAGHIFTAATKPAWAGGNWWAPEVHHIGKELVAYYAALSPTRGKMCIGAARATA